MEPSIELRDVLLRQYEEIQRGQAGPPEQYWSHHDGVMAIGTDPREWWAGFDAVMEAERVGQGEMGDIQFIPGDPQCFVEGTVGWAADHFVWRLPSGRDIPARVTAVFHRDHGQWKLVQMHTSIGQPNTEVLGRELTM